MRAIRSLLIIALLAGMPTALASALMPRPAAAQGMSGMFKAGDIVIETPWIRATPHGASVAGGYMKIINNGKES
ncbi:MAG TPA: hypothetical protein VGQ97_01095, partial [Xanthobacteraceae bacterium]|nr:hypothetical protein [Xanthobacteraceae bacterium]